MQGVNFSMAVAGGVKDRPVEPGEVKPKPVELAEVKPGPIELVAEVKPGPVDLGGIKPSPVAVDAFSQAPAGGTETAASGAPNMLGD